jgi:hypothetical protein
MTEANRLDAYEMAVWRVLHYAEPNDKLTAEDVAAVASGWGRPISVGEVDAVLHTLARNKMVERAGARRSGRRSVQVYWLTRDGRARAQRILGP